MVSSSPVPAALRSRTEAGWLFAASFRPFFVGASLLAALAVPLWIWMFLAGVVEVAGLPARAWHAHEMLFGVLPCIMAGYLLSTTPNWSGRLPISGLPLLILFSLWLGGRLVPLVAPWPVALLDEADLPLAVSAVVVREARV
jgi:uncharacterized protein involved in response to NO